MTFFPKPLLLIVTFQEMTIKHLMYTQKVPILYTERACVGFSSFEICHGRHKKSAVSISDQREYDKCIYYMYR